MGRCLSHRRLSLRAVAVPLVSVLCHLTATAQPEYGLLKPKVPPLGLGFDIYCRVCRHVFEVAAQRVWNYRGSPEDVSTDLRRFCTTELEFSDPEATGRQACPYLIPQDVSAITNVITRSVALDGNGGLEEATTNSLAKAICYEVHEACTKDGKAPTIFGDLDKLKERVKPQKAQLSPPTRPEEKQPQRGPPLLVAGQVKKPKKRRQSVEL